MTKFVPTYVHILLMYAISTGFLFLPIATNAKLEFDYTLSVIPVCESRLYQDTLLVMITVSLLLTFEFFLDCRMEYKLSTPRFIILCALLIPSVLSMFTMSLPPRRKASLFLCCFSVRNSLVIGALLAALVETQSSIKLKKMTFCASLLSIASTNYWVWEPYMKSTPVTSAISLILAFLFLGTVTALLALNCDGLARIINHPEMLSLINALTEEEKFSIIFALALSLNFVCKLVTYFVFNNQTWEDIGVNEVVVFCSYDIFFGVLAFSTTGRIELARAHRQQNLLDSKKNFVRYISHEVRTPLNVVFLGLQFVTTKESIEENKISSETEILLKEVLEACENAINILNELLLYDKVEDGKLVLDRETVPVADLVQKVITPFKAQAAEKKITLMFDGDDHISPALLRTHISVDVNKFSQVLRNLVSNAIKFSPVDGAVHVYAFLTQVQREVNLPEDVTERCFPAVFSECTRYHDREVVKRGTSVENVEMLRIEVHDNGPGISPLDQEKLFHDVVQFNAAELQGGGGSGLGLWISAAIMHKHGGRIGVKSTGIPKEGATFFVEVETVQLRVASPSRSSHQHSQCSDSLDDDARPSFSHQSTETWHEPIPHPLCSPKTPIGNSFSWQDPLDNADTPVNLAGLLHCYECNFTVKTRALVVDDSKLNVKMLVRGIQNFFTVVSQGFDGTDAIEIVTESLKPDGHPIDVIFMDAMMTRVHGPEAVIAIRKMGYKGKIIAVTGNTLRGDVDHFLSCGADVLLGKPVELAKLKDVLHDLGLITWEDMQEGITPLDMIGGVVH